MSLNTRERFEKAVADLKNYADELDRSETAPGDLEQTKLLTMAAAVQDAKKAYDAVKDAHAALNDSQTYLATLSSTDAASITAKQLNDVERTNDGRIAKPAGFMTLGQLLVESDQYKGFKSTYGTGKDGVIPTTTKGINMAPFGTDVGIKTLITGASATSAGAAVRNDLYAPITDLAPFHELSLMDLVTKGNTESDTIEYVRVTGKTNNAAAVAEATSAADGAKPESAIALAVITTSVRTLAHWIPITKRAAADAGQVRTLVDAFLKEGLADVVETEMINGAGTGEHFTGILQTAGILTVGSAGTDIDAIVDAIAAVRVTGRNKPTALVIHPNDWYSTGFLTAKDANGNYIIGDPRASVDQLNTLWGLKVVVTEAMTQNTALVGDFRKAIYWEREGVSIAMTDSHSDFFIRNILVILAELRAAFGVLDPEAFCTVTAV